MSDRLLGAKNSGEAANILCLKTIFKEMNNCSDLKLSDWLRLWLRIELDIFITKFSMCSVGNVTNVGYIIVAVEC
jgi:hypothetical protein